MLYRFVRVQIELQNAIEKVAESIVNSFGTCPSTERGKQGGFIIEALLVVLMIVAVVLLANYCLSWNGTPQIAWLKK